MKEHPHSAHPHHANQPQEAQDHEGHQYPTPAKEGDIAEPAVQAKQALAQPEHAGHGVEYAMLRQGATPDAHAGHGAHVEHTGHEQMFRRRFWVSLVLSIPVLLYSHMLQMWLGFTMPAFPGSDWVGPLFALVVFLYGGIPFLQMAVPELQSRRPGMMTLISLAITVALVYSLAALFIDPAGGFFWEMVLLIDVMLLGHWIEMRSVRQASGALGELANLSSDMQSLHLMTVRTFCCG